MIHFALVIINQFLIMLKIQLLVLLLLVPLMNAVTNFLFLIQGKQKIHLFIFFKIVKSQHLISMSFKAHLSFYVFASQSSMYSFVGTFYQFFKFFSGMPSKSLTALLIRTFIIKFFDTCEREKF